MRRKLAILILYSALLLVSGYIVGRSTATTAAPKEAIESKSTFELNPVGDAASSTSELTDWPNLTP